jgi:hypothetical protein
MQRDEPGSETSSTWQLPSISTMFSSFKKSKWKTLIQRERERESEREREYWKNSAILVRCRIYIMCLTACSSGLSFQYLFGKYKKENKKKEVCPGKHLIMMIRFLSINQPGSFDENYLFPVFRNVFQTFRM